MRTILLTACVAALGLPPAASQARAQDRAASPDTLASLRTEVRHEGRPVVAATVRSGIVGAQTDTLGVATLRLAPGDRELLITRVGLLPETLLVSLRAGQDTTVAIELEEQTRELDGAAA